MHGGPGSGCTPASRRFFDPTGEKLEWRNAIFFPWDPVARKFKGEMVYTDLVFPGRAAA